jgi:hypothetical protein
MGVLETRLPQHLGLRRDSLRLAGVTSAAVAATSLLIGPMIMAQQGVEAVNLVVAEKSSGIPRKEPSGGHNDQARHAQSEVASSASSNRHIVKNDAR